MQTQPKLHVLLGANGDICAMLPFLKLESERTGAPAKVLVSEDFAALFDGVSYAQAVPWKGHFSTLPQALNFLRDSMPEARVVPLQIFGNHGATQKTHSFVHEMWRIAGRPDEWDAHPLVFDRRDPRREAALVAAVDDGRPMILVSRKGTSSPFRFGNELLLSIKAAFGKTHNIIDLDIIQSARVYDLLALYDKADALVSIDTMHLHLSRASKVPVIALTANDPPGWQGKRGWHATPPYRNQVFRINYDDYTKRPMEVVHNVGKIVWKPIEENMASLNQVYADYEMNEEAERRHELALQTQLEEYRLADWCNYKSYHTKGDPPLKIKDIIQCGIEMHHDDFGIIVVTNNDTCFSPGITSQIIRACEVAGSGYAHRWDSPVPLVCPLNAWEIRNLEWYPGCDLFCFTVAWWKQFRDDFPDMVIGCEAWDRIMRELIRSTGGSELIEAIYHERHESKWEVERMTHPGNIHNRKLAREWLKARGMPLLELDFEELP